MKRRTLLQMLAASAAWLRLAPASLAQAPGLSSTDVTRLRALAEVVLPKELGAGNRTVVNDFLRWTRNYREGAEMEAGYGFPRLRKAPPSPARRYPAQLAALGASFESLDLAARRRVVEAAILAAKVERLPERPTGDHVATDLMAFYFHSPAATDLAFRAQIGRDQCRGLPDSDKRPEGVRTGSELEHDPTQLPGTNS